MKNSSDNNNDHSADLFIVSAYRVPLKIQALSEPEQHMSPMRLFQCYRSHFTNEESEAQKS